MLPKERAQIALQGGRPDRVPFVLECDYDYLAKAAGREPWEYTRGDCLERAQIHEGFYARHPSDLWKCWGGPSRAALGSREIIREGDRAFCAIKQSRSARPRKPSSSGIHPAFGSVPRWARRTRGRSSMRLAPTSSGSTPIESSCFHTNRPYCVRHTASGSQ